MIDRDGNRITRGTVLQSTEAGGTKVMCIGYDLNDGEVLLRQDQAGEQAIKLSQNQLVDSAWKACAQKRLPTVVQDL